METDELNPDAPPAADVTVCDTNPELCQPTTTTTDRPQSCPQEDDPCWDCSTMGNRICGPTTATTAVPKAHELARTGPADMIGGLVLFAMALVILGAVLLRAVRNVG